MNRRDDASRSRPMVRGSANAGNFGMAGGQSVSLGAAAPLLEDKRNQPLDGPGFGVDKGGDFNLALTAVVLGKWTASINYVRFLGPEGPTLDNANNAQFKQALKDRNFVTFSLRTTF